MYFNLRVVENAFKLRFSNTSYHFNFSIISNNRFRFQSVVF